MAQRRHVGALREFADYIGRLGLEDQRLRALELFALNGPVPKSEAKYEPGPEQAKVIAMFGLDGDPPTMGGALEELVAWAAADFANSFHATRSVDARELDQLRIIRDKFAVAEESAARFEHENRELRDRLADADRESAKLHEQVELLALLQPDDDEPRSRRGPVEGEQGIYISETAGGTVFEVRYTDPEDGRRRWKTTGSDIQAARLFRDEMQGVNVNA
jgi:hypothetical protein